MEEAFDDLIRLLIQKTGEGEEYVNDQEGRHTINGYWDNIRNYFNGEAALEIEDNQIRTKVEQLKEQYGNDPNFGAVVQTAEDKINGDGGWVSTGQYIPFVQEENVNMIGARRRRRRRRTGKSKRSTKRRKSKRSTKRRRSYL